MKYGDTLIQKLKQENQNLKMGADSQNVDERIIQQSEKIKHQNQQLEIYSQNAEKIKEQIEKLKEDQKMYKNTILEKQEIIDKMAE